MMQFYSKAMVFGPSIITSFLPIATNGLPYKMVLSATGGAPPYTFALISGTLAAGLTLNPSGLISGTPTHSETDTLTFQVTDVFGLKSLPRILTLTVSGTGLNLVGETLPNASIGVPYTQNIAGQASGGTPPYSFALLSSTGGDSWSVSTAGVINGTPGATLQITDTGAFIVTETGAFQSV